jgi:signal peptidase I
MATSRLLVPALCALTLAGAACRAEQAITVRMPSAAMERTLDESEEVVVALRPRGGGDPVEAGDIVLFGFPPDASKRLILRVAGLPGDTLEMRDGTLHRNGRRVRERYATHRRQGVDPAGEEFRWQRHYAPHRAKAPAGHRPTRDDWGPLLVPPGDYFLLGDNRDRSLDSRYWGFVPDSLVLGRVVRPRG